MTKTEKELFEELARLVANKFMAVNQEDDEKFYRLVFRLNPSSEVMMSYECSLFDLARGVN